MCFMAGVEKEKKEGKREMEALRTGWRAKWTARRMQRRQGDEEEDAVAGELVQRVRET